MLHRSGCKDENICFILDESNVKDSGFLERMNTLRANGEVPGLFEGDAHTTLMTQCKEDAQRQGLMLDTNKEMHKWFTHLDLRFMDRYLPGKSMPCDYASRHASPVEDITEEKEQLMVDVSKDIQVMRVIMVDLPPALSMLREVAERNEIDQKLKAAVKEGKKPKDRDLVPYMVVWEELAVIKELVCRGERIIISEGKCSTNDEALRDWVVDLGHSVHQGMDATKRQLRVRLWFPGMDKAVERRVSACLACQASVEFKARDPLKPKKAPDEPWSRMYVDHRAPSRTASTSWSSLTAVCVCQGRRRGAFGTRPQERRHQLRGRGRGAGRVCQGRGRMASRTRP